LAIEKSIEASLAMQRWPKVRKIDQGGWRYLDLLQTSGEPVDSNLSNTVWQMLFLRSAKNAGFDVSQQPIDDAVRFIKSCFHDRYRTFVLMPSHQDHRTRGMAGAGVIALALAGMHRSQEAQTAGDWILEHGFERYNVIEPFGQRGWLDDRYHYGVFYCTQATFSPPPSKSCSKTNRPTALGRRRVTPVITNMATLTQPRSCCFPWARRISFCPCSSADKLRVFYCLDIRSG
jgi:hypothetical protein